MTTDTRRKINIGVPELSEHQEQSTFFDWLDFFQLREHPEVHPLFFAVPNGVPLKGDKKMRNAMMNKLKKEGFTPGVADTIFLSGRGGYLGLVMEFKRPSVRGEENGGLSENQMEFLRAAATEGYLAKVAYGADEAIAIATQYLSWPTTQELVGTALKALERGDVERAKTLLTEAVSKW